ncbi:unnamed protein product [Auanema sp. JU1783]|nr:unnamed protein product [Auanema sp. JU1783]
MGVAKAQNTMQMDREYRHLNIYGEYCLVREDCRKFGRGSGLFKIALRQLSRGSRTVADRLIPVGFIVILKDDVIGLSRRDPAHPRLAPEEPFKRFSPLYGASTANPPAASLSRKL